MNYYSHHIGDYDSRTAHLEWVEDMAYTRLLRLYYRSEKPIPADLSHVCRLVRAKSKDERKAVETVLAEYFQLLDDGWHNDRADKEIAKYQAKASANRENGKAGGRPKQTEEEPKNNPDGFDSLTQKNLNQEPRTKNQEPINSASPEPPPQPVQQSVSAQWSIALRAKGIKATSIHPTLIQWIEDKFTLPAVLEAVEIARLKKPAPAPIELNYLDRIVRDPPKKAVDQWWLDDNKMMSMAQQYGVATYGKQRDQLKSDIFMAMKNAATQAVGA